MAGKDKSTVITAFVFDFETGGLDCRECAATQVSIQAIRLDTFELMETYNSYILPYKYQENAGKPPKKVLKSKFDKDEAPLMAYTEKALDYSAITMDMLYGRGVELDIVCDEILAFIERNTLNVGKSNLPILVGQNVGFDIGYFQQIFVYTKKYDKLKKLLRGTVDFFGNFQPYYIDTIELCQLAFNHDRSINSYKLELEAEMLGIELDDAHDADADVTATREVLQVLTKRMRQKEGESADTSDMVQNKKQKLRDHFKI